MKYFALICAGLLAAPACAQEFNVSMGGKTLGQLEFVEQGNTATLETTLDSTPMGVFNGTFTGTSNGTTATSRFVAESRSSRKQRSVTVEIAQGRATSTAVTPQEELTDLSDITRVPSGVMDPVRTIGALISAGSCPAAMQMYDGRRVVSLSPAARDMEGGTLTCTMDYRVIAGPGHLSPLGISSAKLLMRYDPDGVLRQIQIVSGIFRVSLDRQG
ncbi:DUF3108 domain-containing protein [Sulfitobacter guttiformis]|uniref:DUF3108 domain-containing protein n=1 Tax=Sulfitobacter guttiformis TaxID=74349 RepID=A0A420DQM1_9RHOB|nr:hypothetical protein [Sulfitobacter guttiformis]KIN73783.1 hypothetical protein Z949_2975 [Sulfitobacter guttiformis KCTC 32187]RKE96417.1 hypothetical protein C8N30_0975 [Sulfitobacter guttiformis]